MAGTEEPIQWLGALSAGQSAVLAAVGAGLLGLIVAFCLSARGGSPKPKKDEKPEPEETSTAAEEKRAEPQKKQWKAKSTGRPRKTSLRSHPLLAADFKGHTGAVLSIDFDTTGKYLVSCSEGLLDCCWKRF